MTPTNDPMQRLAAYRTEIDEGVRERHLAQMGEALRAAPTTAVPTRLGFRRRFATALATLTIVVVPVGAAVAAENRSRVRASTPSNRSLNACAAGSTMTSSQHTASKNSRYCSTATPTTNSSRIPRIAPSWQWQCSMIRESSAPAWIKLRNGFDCVLGSESGAVSILHPTRAAPSSAPAPELAIPTPPGRMALQAQVRASLPRTPISIGSVIEIVTATGTPAPTRTHRATAMDQAHPAQILHDPVMATAAARPGQRQPRQCRRPR